MNIYAELIEGKSKKVIPVGKPVSKLEVAINRAIKELYRLKDKQIPFSRVFISDFNDADKARKDPNSFDYFSRR